MAQETLKPILGQEQFGREQANRQTGVMNEALQRQHPAIQGLQQLEAEQKALPQELEAAGRIQAAGRQAQGVMGAAGQRAGSDQRNAIIGLLGPILEQITKAREQSSLDATDPDLQDFAGRNQEQEAKLNALMQLMLSRPEFEF